MLVTAAEIHIWQVRLDGPDWRSAEGLPVEEQDRAAGLLAGSVRQRWIAARRALREVLGRYVEQQPVEIELRSGEHGKPMLAAAETPLRFNLSHSGERAVVALAWEREVGVDVEQIRARRNLLALAERALAPAEAAQVKAASPESQLGAFHAAWTRHEAVAKCLGTGIAAPLPEGEVVVSNFDAGADFAAAVAVQGKWMPPLRHFELCSD